MKAFFLRPTRLGYYLIGLNFILFLLSIGYSNNLLFLFTLILMCQSLYWYVETALFTHPVIRDLKVSSCFAGEFNTISFSFDGPRFQKVLIKIGNKKYHIHEFTLDESRVMVPIKLEHRGVFQLKKLEFYDSRPFSLFAKAIKLQNETPFFVYPKLLKDINLGQETNEAQIDGPENSHSKGEEDFLGLIPYQGEDFKKISWKQFARSDELYIKQGLLPLLPHMDFVLGADASEEEISLIASKIVLAHRQQYSFTLKIKEQLISYDSGKFHLQYCLERLSEC